MNSQQCVEFVKEQLAEKPDRDLSGICELVSSSNNQFVPPDSRTNTIYLFIGCLIN